MDTWFTRDLPILDALARHYDDPQARDLLADDLPAIVNRDPDDVNRALTHLAAADPPYILGVMVAQASYPVRITGVTERGRRAAGQWPQVAEALATELIAQLARAADAAGDQEQAGRFRRAAQALRELGRDVLVATVSKAITEGMPGDLT